MPKHYPIFLVLIGDSDIARWPQSLHPYNENITKTLVYGRCGATLFDIEGQIFSAWDEITKEGISPNDTKKYSSLWVIFLVCAGENDLSSGGFSEDEIGLRLQRVLDDLLGTVHKSVGCIDVLFLGPKFEPWLSSDMDSRKSYAKLSGSLKRVCNRKNLSGCGRLGVVRGSVTYFDCLVMFCGDSGRVPGAVWGGKAIPDERFFNEDGLHLSDEGYILWKGEVEDHLRKILQDQLE